MWFWNRMIKGEKGKKTKNQENNKDKNILQIIRTQRYKKKNKPWNQKLVQRKDYQIVKELIIQKIIFKTVLEIEIILEVRKTDKHNWFFCKSWRIGISPAVQWLRVHLPV